MACSSPQDSRHTVFTELACLSETLRFPAVILQTVIPLTSLILPATAQSVWSPEKTKEGLEVEESASGRLLQEESKKEGAVAFHVYRAYWRAIGLGLALAILSSLLLMQGRNKPRSPYPTHSLVF